VGYKLIDEKVNTKKGLKLIFSEFFKYKKRILIIVLCQLIFTIASVLTPLILKYAIDDAINKGDVGKLWFYAGYFILLMVVMNVMSVIQMRLTGYLAQKVLFTIRSKIFTKLQEMPMAFFSQNQSGDIIQRLTGNVEGINNFFSEGFVRMLNIFFSVTGYLIVMFALNATLGAIVVGSIILIILYLLIQGKTLNRLYKKTLDNEGLMTSQLQETLNGFHIIKIYKKENEFESVFKDKNKTYYKSVLKANILSSLTDGALPFIFSITTVTIVSISLNLYSQGVMTQGDVLAYLTYLVTFFRRFDFISSLWNNLQSGLASSARINELLQKKSDIVAPENAYNPDLKNVNGEISFENVCFAYEENEPDVLKDINLSIQPGQTIAVVGPTGGGKTSFVNLIARLYDVKCGEVLVDDRNVKEWNLDALRRSIGYLIQEAIFFSGSVWENLSYDNPNTTKEQALKVLEELGGETILSALPQGIDTVLTADSKLLSSGQRQILALTRLMLRDPKILILDEATSNIDTRSEKVIQKAIEIIRKGKTTFIIAHRLSTIFNADKIILIQNNTIIESGTHEELLKKKGVYYGIYAKFIGK